MFNLIRPFRSAQKHRKTRRSVLRRDHQSPAIENLEARVLLHAGGFDLGAPAVDEPADHGDGISYEVAAMHWLESSTPPGHKKHVDHATWDTDPTVDALVTVTVLVHDHGTLTTDKVARINDAVAEINSARTKFDVLLDLQTTTDENASHQIHLHETGGSNYLGLARFAVFDDHTEPGEFKDGHGNHLFLGEQDVGGRSSATLFGGHDWYAGSDPALIGVGQYDYQTVATHELLHLVGLDHDDTDYSADPADPEVADNSDQLLVMNTGLAAGKVQRLMSTHDQETLRHLYGSGQTPPDDGGGGGGGGNKDGGGGGGNKGGGKGGGKSGAGMSGIMAGTSQQADILAPFVLRETSSLFDYTQMDQTSDAVESAAAITSPHGMSAVSAYEGSAYQPQTLPTDDQTTDGLSDGRLTDEDSADEEAIIDAEFMDNLFAEFNESFRDELLAV